MKPKFETKINPDTVHEIKDFSVGDKVIHRVWHYEHIADTKGHPAFLGGYGYIKEINLEKKYQIKVYFPLLKKMQEFGEHEILILKS